MIITEPICNQRPAQRDIAALESLINGVLPDDYKLFLIDRNGGRPAPNRFRFARPGGRIEDASVHYFFALHSGRVGSLNGMFARFTGRIPEGHLPIASDPFGNLVLLETHRGGDGAVYFWDHEQETSMTPLNNRVFIAKSFSEFVRELR